MIATDDRKTRLQDAIARKECVTQNSANMFNILMDKRDHPTADEVFVRARRKMPSISLATVYNCLDTLVSVTLCGRFTLSESPLAIAPILANMLTFTAKKQDKFST